MGEGVDPTRMCQSLVEKETRSRQLRATSDPDLLLLFEDWFEELEAETRRILQDTSIGDEHDLAARLGVSPRGARFLLSKLSRDEER